MKQAVADHHELTHRVEVALDGVMVADAPAELDRHMPPARRDHRRGSPSRSSAGRRCAFRSTLAGAGAFGRPMLAHSTTGRGKTVAVLMSPCFRRTPAPVLQGQ